MEMTKKDSSLQQLGNLRVEVDSFYTHSSQSSFKHIFSGKSRQLNKLGRYVHASVASYIPFITFWYNCLLMPIFLIRLDFSITI